MRKFVGTIGTNKVGSSVKFEFEVDDECTESEIEEYAQEVAFENIDWTFEEVE
jgi:hypothetical protein